MSGYCVHYWDIGQVLKQSKNGLLENNVMGYAQISWRSLGILILILLDAKIVKDPRRAIFIY